MERVMCLLALLLLASARAEQDKELKVEFIEKPPADCERKAQDGDFLSVHYTGVLAATGEKFSSSHDHNRPYNFTLGRGEVIRGYDVGLKGMCVGETRRLIIPPHMAYGDRGTKERGGGVPPKATLIFDVELLEIKLLSEFKMEVLEKPPKDCDQKAEDHDFLSVHYTGVLATTGEKFSSSRDNNRPYTFILGRKEVIQGYEVGMQGMCVGEKRRFTVPPDMAYGNRGDGRSIPPGATLIFDVELLELYRAETGKLKVEILQPKPANCTPKAKDGDRLAVHYVGKVAKTGKKFESSRDIDRPFKFTLGRGEVIDGYEEGMQGICVGEIRRLIVPSYMAYGDRGAGEKVPPMATLIFDVELLENQPAPTDGNVFYDIDKDENKKLTREEMERFLSDRNQDGSAPQEEGTAGHDDLISEIFEEQDEDQDGVISFEEFHHDEL